MDSAAHKTVERALEDFLNHLYDLDKSPTMAYGINHSCMEVWVAIEGLEFFATRGWTCWETLGFITNKPVRGAKNKAGIKFPDLVCVKDGVSLWWEFKAISPLALHPQKAGGTFVEDLLALASFDGEKTRRYLANGRLTGARQRDDSNNIQASRLGSTLGVGRNWGVAILFTPAREQVGWIADVVDRLTKRVDGLLVPGSTITKPPLDVRKAASGGDSLTEKRWPEKPSLPDWHAWIVDMGHHPSST